ncbi:helix-turn-helix domain-containing protein [Actinomadura rugatobispora]|uniref:Helix-turn-helix domain-containing protein n=1 Tax=Actinomadura rugatobispora TaxID=1994 RepID=A0ABW1A549_9ACTN
MAAELGVSRQYAHRRMGRFRHQGWDGLADRRSGPRFCPSRTPAQVDERVPAVRRELRAGPDRTPARPGPARTVTRTLHRHGVPALAACDPGTGQQIRASRMSPQRYEHAAPGEMIHLDVKLRTSADRHPGRYGCRPCTWPRLNKSRAWPTRLIAVVSPRCPPVRLQPVERGQEDPVPTWQGRALQPHPRARRAGPVSVLPAIARVAGEPSLGVPLRMIVPVRCGGGAAGAGRRHRTGGWGAFTRRSAPDDLSYALWRGCCWCCFGGLEEPGIARQRPVVPRRRGCSPTDHLVQQDHFSHLEMRPAYRWLADRLL